MNRHLFSYFATFSTLAIVSMTSGCSKSGSNFARTGPTPTPTAKSSPRAIAMASPGITPMPGGSPFADVQLRLRELNKKMDDVFTQTFRNLGTSFGGSGFAASVDLREQKDRYVARVYVPNRDTSKVNTRIDNGNLHITMDETATQNGATTSQKYEQIINLPEPVRADQMQVERKPNVVVLTIPKSNNAVAVASPQPSVVAVASPQPTPAASASASPTTRTGAFASNWDQHIIDEMRRMQTQMDEIFRSGFQGDMLDGSSMIRLGSSVNVDNEKDKYVVHFALPHRDLTNVKVDYDNGELRLSAGEQKKTENNSTPNTMESIERSSYEEAITLPGPVKENEMKVDRQANAVVVTLPKA